MTTFSGLGDISKRINLSWFYPGISKFQDDLKGNQEKYFNFLNTPHEGSKPVLLYIHIPFCESFCAYCACFKEPLGKYTHDDRSRFVDALLREMEMYAHSEYFSGLKINHIQFGGGTPSCLDNDLMEKIFAGIEKNFDLAPNRGVSFEGNVMTLKSVNKLQHLKDLGVKRLSFGIQTFDEQIRKELKIKAASADIYETVDAIHSVGFPSFAIDLIYNLPNQDLKLLENDLLKTCREIAPAFIQTYRFNQFYNTWLQKKIAGGYYANPPSAEKELLMFEFIMDFLAKQGYNNQVLINMFSNEPSPDLTGLELSLGNNNPQGSYALGLGPGSMSFLGKRSYRTYCSIKDYVEAVEAHQFPVEAGNVCTEEVAESRLMVFFPNFTRTALTNIPPKYQDAIGQLVREGYAAFEENEVVLTKKGKLWAGDISFLFYTPDEKKKLQTSFYYSLKNKKNPFNQDDMNVSQ